MERKNEQPPRKHTDEEHQTEAAAKFIERQRREGIENATDAEIISLSPPEKKDKKDERPEAPATAMEIAYAKAAETKRRAEEALGVEIGNDLLNRLSDPASLEKLSHAEPSAGAKDAPALPTAPPENIPSELARIYGDTVPPAALEMFGKLKGKTKRESYIAKLAADEAERKKRTEERKRDRGRPRKGKPKSKKPEAKPRAAEPVAAAAAVAEAEPAISPVSRRLEAEEQKAIDERIAAAHAAEPVAAAAAPEPAPAAAESLPAVFRSNRDLSHGGTAEAMAGIGKPNPDEDEEYPAVWRYNRNRRGMGANPNASEPAGEPERTPKEWREKLRELIEGAKGKVEWWKSAEEHLIRRNQELDARLEKESGVERGFRWLGEKYNKLPFKYKIALGVTLGLGTAATAGTLAVAFPLLGLAAQRAAGLATMYMKFEKNSHQEKWGKEKAMLKAGVYTVLMGLAIKEAIEYASETDLAHTAQAKVEEWLGTMLGHPIPEVSQPAPAADTGGPPAGVAASASITQEAQGIEAPVQISEAPEISVVATQGKGAEYMMKRMWEGLQDLKQQGLDVSQYPEGSDMHTLLTATPENIDAVVHRIAADPQHGFFNPDGTSVRIDLGSHMTVDTEGNILLNEAVQAPAHAPVTPAYAPAEPALSHETIPSEDPVQTIDLTEAQDQATRQATEASARPEVSPGQETVAEPEQPGSPVEALEEQTVPSAPDAAAPAEQGYLMDSEGRQVLDSQGNPIRTDSYESPAPAEAPAISEASPPAPTIEHMKEFINQNKLPIDPLHGHIFQDTTGAIIAYGNDFNARFDAAQDFAKANPNTSVWVQAKEPVFYEGAWRPWVFEVKYGGLWRGMQILGADGPTTPSQIGGINPDAFIKQLDK